jgi:hypothetical protein
LFHNETKTNNNTSKTFLNVSATPGAILYDMLKWGNKHKLIFLEPPETYVGFNVFLQEKRLLNSQILSEDFLNNEILPLLKNRFKKPKYHIFRELNSIRRDLLEKFCIENNYIFQTFDSESNKSKLSKLDIDSIITEKNDRDRFVLSKGHSASSLYAILDYLNIKFIIILSSILSNDVILLFFGNNNLKENSKGGGGTDGGNDDGNDGCLFWKNGNDPNDKGSEIKNKIIFRIGIYIYK